MSPAAPGRTRFSALAALRRSRGLGKLLAMMALSFLVIFVVGVLRPIRDAIALYLDELARLGSPPPEPRSIVGQVTV